MKKILSVVLALSIVLSVVGVLSFAVDESQTVLQADKIFVDFENESDMSYFGSDLGGTISYAADGGKNGGGAAVSLQQGDKIVMAVADPDLNEKFVANAKSTGQWQNGLKFSQGVVEQSDDMKALILEANATPSPVPTVEPTAVPTTAPTAEPTANPTGSENGLVYEIVDDKAIITQVYYTQVEPIVAENDGVLYVPSTIGGYPVTEITGTFVMVDGMKVAIVPEGVVKFGENTFSNCEELTTIYLPASLEEIGLYAFLYSENLTDVYYGGSEEDRENINIVDSIHQGWLLTATWHYNSDAEDAVPTVDPTPEPTPAPTPNSVQIEVLEDTSYYLKTKTGLITNASVKDGVLTKKIYVTNIGEDDFSVNILLQATVKNAEGKDTWAGHGAGYVDVPAEETVVIEYECEVNDDGTVTIMDQDVTLDKLFVRLDFNAQGQLYEGTKLIISGDKEIVDALLTNASSDKIAYAAVIYDGIIADGDVLHVAMIALVAVASVMAVVVAARKKKED